MKRLFAAFLAVTMLVLSVFTLASCGKPELDFDDAKDALEDAGYYVSIERGTDETGDVTIDRTLQASKSESDDFLYIVVYNDVKSAKISYEALKLEMEEDLAEAEAEIEMYELQIKALKTKLRKYDDELKSDEIKALEKQIETYEDKIKDLKEDIKESKNELVFGRSGKYVWYGDAKAIEDSKD